MKYLLTRTFALIVLIASFTMIVNANAAVGTTYTLHTLRSFTELLVGKGLIPASLAEKAYTIARIFTPAPEDVVTSNTVLNADRVIVSVSQLIEHANLEFAAGTDITGPLVIVKNMSASSTVLEAKRQCQVVYRIYDTADTLLYDSATTEVCTTDEQITYQLQGHGIRMFPIRHTATAYPLVVGTYRFVLEYPGYGEGSVMVTIE